MTPPDESPQPPSKLRFWRTPLVLTTAIALVVHLPVPMFSWLRLARRAIAMRDATQPLDEPEKKVEPPAVPIELFELPKTEPAKDGEAWGAPVKAPSAPAAEKTEVKLGTSRETDKEQKDDGDKAAEGPGDKKKSKGKDDTKSKKDQGKPAEKDELGMKGAKDQALAGKPAVMLAMWLGALREHAMSDTAEKLFACAPEWRPFVAEGVRPLHDVEGVMVMGPKLMDGAKMTVAIQHHLGAEKKAAVTRSLIEKSGARGGTIEEGVSKILLMRHERAVFDHPTDMLFLTPTDGYKPIFRSKDPLSLPPSNGRALSLTLQKPSRAMARLGVKVPERMKELRLEVFANPDGGSDLQIDLEDATPEDAARSAKGISDAVTSLFVDLGKGAEIARAFGEDAIADAVKLPKVTFDADGARLSATAHFDAAQTKKMLAVLARVICPKPRK